MPRPSRPLITRDRAAGAALEIIDTEGLEALSTRRLSTELGVSAPSLYSHFAGRDEILEAVVELIFDRHEPDMPAPVPGETWQQHLERFAHHYLAVLAEHPNAVRTIACSPIRSRTSLRCFDAAFAALRAAGFAPQRAVHMLLAVDCFVLGTGLDLVSRGFPEPAESYAPEYPALAEILTETGQYTSSPGSFSFGLRALLRGLSESDH